MERGDRWKIHGEGTERKIRATLDCERIGHPSRYDTTGVVPNLMSVQLAKRKGEGMRPATLGCSTTWGSF